MSGIDAKRDYQLVVDGFTALGAAEPEAIRRAIIFRDRTFVGQRFRCDGLQAIWLAGEASVAFYDGQGEFLKTVPLGARPATKAA